jgi:polar amino acid transport system substrate-binding protein
VSLLAAGCDLPRDPEGTLEEVRGGSLRVGVLQGNRYAEQVDRQIVGEIARRLQAQPAFSTAEAHTLFEMLHRGEIHIVIGGIPTNTPFGPDAGLSRPAGPLFQSAGDEDRVLAVRSGENAFLKLVNEEIGDVLDGAGA